MGLFKPNVEKLTEKRNVEGLVKALDYQKDPDVREYAAEALGVIGDPLAVEPLIRKLNAERNSLRRYAAEALGKIGDARAAAPLLKALKDRDFNVQNTAGEALCAIGEPAVEALIKALRDESWDARRCAAEILGRIGGARAAEALIEALEVVGMRLNAATALGKAGDARAVAPLVRMLKDKDAKVRKASAEALDALQWKPESAEQKIYGSIAKGNWRELAEIGAPAVEPLTEILSNTDLRDSHANAAKALGAIGDPRAVDPLISALNSEEAHHAAVALGDIGDPRAVNPLIMALQERRSICGVAAVALGNIGDARALEPLLAALTDTDRYLRECAVKALGKLGDTRAVEPLIEALKDEWTHVAAEEALGNLGDARAVKFLLHGLDDNYIKSRKTTAQALIQIAKANKTPEIFSKEMIQKIRQQHADTYTATGQSSDCTSRHSDNAGIGLDFDALMAEE